MEYQEEQGTMELFLEAMPLLEAHEEELNTFDCDLDADLVLYVRAAYNGGIAFYTVRDEGELVGYAVYWIRRHPHYNLMIADQDILFLRRDLRNGRVGLKLIKFSEAKLKERGINVVTQRTKKHFDLGKLYAYLGYSLQEEVYTKEI